jgi:hypothetical protein
MYNQTFSYKFIDYLTAKRMRSYCLICGASYGKRKSIKPSDLRIKCGQLMHQCTSCKTTFVIQDSLPPKGVPFEPTELTEINEPD